MTTRRDFLKLGALFVPALTVPRVAYSFVGGWRARMTVQQWLESRFPRRVIASTEVAFDDLQDSRHPNPQTLRDFHERRLAALQKTEALADILRASGMRASVGEPIWLGP